MTRSPLDRDVAFAREKASRSLPVSLLLLLGIIAMELPLPQRFVAALPLALAIGLSVRLLHFLQGRRGRDLAWPVITLVLTLVLTASLTLQGLFYSSVKAYEECLAAAQTQVAAADCELQRQQGPFGAGFLLR